MSIDPGVIPNGAFVPNEAAVPNEEVAPNGGIEPNVGTVVEFVDVTGAGANGLDELLAPNANEGLLVVGADTKLKPPLPNGIGVVVVVVVDVAMKLLGFVEALVVEDTGNEIAEVTAVKVGTLGEKPDRFEVVLVIVGKDGADVLDINVNAGNGTDETVDTTGAAAAVVVVDSGIMEVLPNVPKDNDAGIFGAIVATEDVVELVTVVLGLVVDTGTKGWNVVLLAKGLCALIVDVLSNAVAIVPNIGGILVATLVVAVADDEIGATPNDE